MSKGRDGLNQFAVCRSHRGQDCTQCPAISLKGWLRRKGYAYGQYQGTVKTDAGRETIRQWADQFIARYYNNGSVGLDAFDAIPTSVLALNHLRIGNAPLHGYGCFGKYIEECK
jgi:methionine salvage enolase-phosphatase E1